MDQNSVNHDIVGYGQIFNNLKPLNKLKQLHNGFSYVLKEKKEKDKVKARKDDITIVAAPYLNNTMMRPD